MPKKTKAPTKYDTHIKPRLKEIARLYECGYNEKQIYTTLRVSRTVWNEAKENKKDLKNALNIDKKISKEIEQLIKYKETLFPIEKYNELNAMLLESDNLTMDTLQKALRQQYPMFNHYLQQEIEKNAIAWHEAETKRMALDKEETQIQPVIINTGGAIKK